MDEIQQGRPLAIDDSARSGSRTEPAFVAASITTPACPVLHCKAKTPHMDDSTVKAFMRQSPAEVIDWTKRCIVELIPVGDRRRQQRSYLCVPDPLARPGRALHAGLVRDVRRSG